jgi:septal ring factor EnvC (AmiA/AmiB activator)
LKHLARIILLLTGLLMAAATAAPPDPAETRAKEAELKRLRDTIQQLSDNLGSLRSRHQAQRARLREMNRKINRLDRSLRDTEQQRRRLANSLTDLQQEQTEQQRRLAVQRQALARQLQAAYVLGRLGGLELLLNAAEPAAVQRSLRYYDYFYRSRTAHIAELKKTLLSLDQVQQSIQGKRQELDAVLAHQRDQREALESSRRERRALLAELNRDIRSTSRRLGHLKEDAQALQDLVKRLRQALAKMPAPPSGESFARLKGRLPLPVAGRITARFGAPRDIGQMKWQGVLIDAADGAEVKAVAAGRVVFADWLRGFGLLLILDHGDGYMSLYGNNQGLRVGVGDTVQAGEVVANVGNDGGQDSDGLYFEIRYKGTPQDPLLWCSAR